MQSSLTQRVSDDTAELGSAKYQHSIGPEANGCRGV